MAGSCQYSESKELTAINELLDRLLADYKNPEDLIGENGLLKQLTKRLVGRALEVEMAEQLGHGKFQELEGQLQPV